MTKVKDVLEDSQVPGVGSVDMTSWKSIGALFVGTLGLFTVSGAAGYTFSRLKSASGADEMTSPLSGVLGDI